VVSSRPEASGHLRPAAADPTRNLGCVFGFSRNVASYVRKIF